MSITEAFSDTLTVGLPDGRNIVFARMKMKHIAKLSEGMKEAKRKEQEDALADRLAAELKKAGNDPGRIQAVYTYHQLARQKTPRVKVEMQDVYELLRSPEGILKILRFAAENADQDAALIDFALDALNWIEQDGIANELFAVPISPNPPKPGAEKQPTSGESQPSSDPSTESTPAS